MQESKSHAQFDRACNQYRDGVVRSPERVRARRNPFKTWLALVAATLVAVSATACAAPSSPPSGAATAGAPILVVTSTTVYADLVATVGGDQVEARAIITSTASDPHSHQASARDRLLIADADLIVVNGGGYDAFMDPLLEVTDAIPLVAMDLVNTDNEHLWYDLAAVRTIVDALAANLSTIAPAHSGVFHENAKQLTAAISELEQRAARLSTVVDGAQAFVTEPLPLALLDAAGYVDVTPPGLAQTVEAGSEISPNLMNAGLALIKGGKLALFAQNQQTAGADTAKLAAAAAAAGVPVITFSEGLPDGLHYVEWMSANLDAIEATL